MLRGKRLSILSILFTFFVDNLGWSIVFPIFAVFFLDTSNHLFSPETSIEARTTILGIFLALFPLAQFFGSPVLGALADKVGRKKAFLWSISLTFIGYVLSALSMRGSLLWLLFASRIISGLFSGNLSICLATLSDVSQDEKTKVKFFGYLSILVGISFILGTLIGGKFSDATINEAFTPDFPFWIAAILGFCNFFFVFFAFKETFMPHEEVKVDRWEGIHNIQEAVQTSKLKPAYLIYFLFIFAWTLLFQFMPVRMIRSFSYTSSQIGNLAAFMGVCWALGSGLLNKIFLKKFSYLKILEVTLFGFTGVCFAIAVPVEKHTLLGLFGLCVVFGGMTWPLCTTMISNLSPKHMQGKMLGISQSMQSLAMATAPILGGVVDQIYPHMPFLLAAIAGLMAAWTYFFVKP